jgi:hypothetical protein
LKAGSVGVALPIAGKVRVPAIVRLRCVRVGAECKVGDVVVAPGATLPLPGSPEAIALLVEEVRPPGTPAAFPSGPTYSVVEVLVRFVVHPEVLALIKVGDTDQGALAAGEGRMASLTTVKPKEELSGVTNLSVGASVTHLTEKLTVLETVLRLPVRETPAGWQYKGQPVKGGAAFTFETRQYTMSGRILRILSPS